MSANVLESNPHRAVTEASIRELRDFIAHFRDAMQEMPAKGEIDAHRTMENTTYFNGDTMTEEVEDSTRVLGAFIPHIHKYYYALPKLFGYSCIIQVYTLLEDRGRDLCNTLNQKDKNIAVSVDTMKGRSAFEKIRVFLTQHCGIQHSDWPALDFLRRIRNELAHNNGLVTKKPLLEEIKRRNAGVSIDKRGYLSIDPTFVDDALNKVAGLFEQVYRERNFGQGLSFGYVPDDIEIHCEKIDGKLKVQIKKVS